jgi:glycosyltransferase involved in cell wall biosynthesis
MTRVLLVSPSAMPGGAERALASLARHLPPFGLEPQAVLLQDGPLVGWLEEAGCPVVQIPAGRMRQIPRALCTVQKLRRVMRLGKARVVVSNMEKGHIYGGLAALGEGIPAVWWQQGIPEGGGRFQLLAARVRAACVVCSCEEAVAAQRRLTPRLRVSKVHLGSAVDQIRSRRGSGRAVRARLGWDDNPIVGIVGRLQPWKGQAVFLRAAAQVASVRPDARFLVVGGAILGWEGDYPAELYRLAAELGLKGRVHFAGHQSDVYPWFDALDVVVHASEGELSLSTPCGPI